MILRCTARLMKLLAGRGGLPVEAPPGVDDWYGHLFVVERRKCLVLVHADTLFSVIDTDVRVAQLDDLGIYLATRIIDALASEGLPGGTLGPTDPSKLQVAKTASRSVLGHINEIILDAQYAIEDAGGLQHANLHVINHEIRTRLRGRDGNYVIPLELATERST